MQQDNIRVVARFRPTLPHEERQLGAALAAARRDAEFPAVRASAAMRTTALTTGAGGVFACAFACALAGSDFVWEGPRLWFVCRDPCSPPRK